MATAKMPNAVWLVSTWAKSRPTITALVSKRISHQLGATFPAIRLADVGPRDRAPEEALNRVQVECWADDYDTADDIARTVESEVDSLRGSYPTVGAFCAGGSVALGPFASPDESSARYRFLLDLELWVYPA